MKGDLQYWHLVVGATSMLLLGVSFFILRIGLLGPLTISTIRMISQLLILGVVLEYLFETRSWMGTLGFLILMIGAATRESTGRLKYRLQGIRNVVVPLVSLTLAALPYTLMMIFIIFRPKPWYDPALVLPVFGMILGNIMNTISLALNQFFHQMNISSAVIEQRLALGHPLDCITASYRLEATRTAMLPILNSMAVTGIVSLPGMMTGQILAGESPEQAVCYQILIWFGIASGAGAACLAALHLALRSISDHRGRPSRIQTQKN